jgi:putative holliday junction resolvase
MAGVEASSTSPLIILAFDYGTRRIGVASGDTLTRTARPLKTLQCAPSVPWPQIDHLVQEYHPRQFIVGLPYNMDGTPTPLTKTSRRFATDLKSRYAQPVALIDERLSSREASEQIRRARSQGIKARRATHEDIDRVAARILLERWFDDPAGAEVV